MVPLIALFLAAAPPAPGSLVDVGGYRVHINCTGTGTATVVILGGFSLDWALVQPEVAKFTRVCTYDASGNAWSDPGPAPTCANRVDEIHRMLTNAHVDGPYVLTGFSVGALFARLYGQSYPAEVASMVFIDHAFLPPPSPPPPIASGRDSPPAVLIVTPIEFGVEDEPGYERLPEQVRELHRWAASRSPARPDPKLAEDCLAQIGKATLSDIPLVVVSTPNDAPGYANLQSSLLGLSQRSHQIIADRSFHSVEISQPTVVVEAIRQAFREAKK
jgi:pimeloyl-ACP methyl ester carboxylesterase